MSLRLKLLLIFVLFAIFGVGPVPITSLLGIFIVLFRPAWFKQLVLDLYDDTKL